MPPRMKLPTKGKKKAPATFNHHHFMSREAEARYVECYSTKPLLAERGFELKGQVLESVGAEIEKRQWTEWAMQPIRGKVELAKEFYANLHEAKMDKVWLLGRWVSFSAETINQVLGIPHEQQDVLAMDEEGMAEFLCPEGTQWEIKNGKFCHFPKRDMSMEAQAWLYFVSARLLPATHYSEVTPDRCRVLYAILRGLTINIGKIIYKEMLKVTPQKKSLPFPSLITLLSMTAGPEEGYGEVTYLDCLPPITDKTLARIAVTITRERKLPSREEAWEKKRPLKALKEEVAKLKEKVEKHKNYNLAMWKLWAQKNNIPEEELPEYETSEEEESEGEAPSSDMD